MRSLPAQTTPRSPTPRLPKWRPSESRAWRRIDLGDRRCWRIVGQGSVSGSCEGAAVGGQRNVTIADPLGVLADATQLPSTGQATPVSFRVPGTYLTVRGTPAWR